MGSHTLQTPQEQILLLIRGLLSRWRLAPCAHLPNSCGCNRRRTVVYTVAAKAETTGADR
jgi:hypothetical protein